MFLWPNLDTDTFENDFDILNTSQYSKGKPKTFVVDSLYWQTFQIQEGNMSIITMYLTW